MEMIKAMQRRLVIRQKRRKMQRVLEHIGWLVENIDFARREIPRYEAEVQRLQAEIWVLEPAELILQQASEGKEPLPGLA